MDFSKTKKSLESKGYKVTTFETSKQASDYLNSAIDGKTVGIGGSVTIRDMGLYESLSSHNEMSWHWKSESPKTALEKSRTTEIYLSSINGLSEDGEIINIDGTGNRVASIQFGHKKVYFVVGKNKIARDFDSALYRAKNVAAPLNARRLNCKTPCALGEQKCYNCKSPDRICKGLSVLWFAPSGCEYEVVLINEDLGY